MNNGSGVLAWGVGGIEAEAVMLGQSITMVVPEVIGYKLIGSLPSNATATDLVLAITKELRSFGVVGKFVEFFGPGVATLDIADRATIANMCPEYGATIGFFPVDNRTIRYLRLTGRDEHSLRRMESYLKAIHLFVNYEDEFSKISYSKVYELDLSSIVPCVSGPKRPHDVIPLRKLSTDFTEGLTARVSFKGFGIKEEDKSKCVIVKIDGKNVELKHGSIVISAITSCTNTSNPSVMLGAGLVAKKAVEAGLRVPQYVKTSLSPGSGVVTAYLEKSGLLPYLQKLGYHIVGYGCMTCIGNSGALHPEVTRAIEENGLVVAGVLSGNRNFEGRIHSHVRANYLASPPLVVVYGLAGRIDIDLENEPIGVNDDGKKIYFHDIWPSREEISTFQSSCVIPKFFADIYSNVHLGSDMWQKLHSIDSQLYPWDDQSTYIRKAPFFENMTKEPSHLLPIRNAHALLNVGDSVTTDHISPAGSISMSSPAARYLLSKGVEQKDFNTYGARRGNDEVMTRGTFANIRLMNKLIGKTGPRTVFIPSGEEMSVFDAAEMYKKNGLNVIILAGKDYGCGSSRDWAAKGPSLLGVKAVIAESYERIHRSNLVGMGIMPLQYKTGENAQTLNLSGREVFSIEIPEVVHPHDEVQIKLGDGRSFSVINRLDTKLEVSYYYHGGVLPYMVRKLISD
ncbi:hypothetical protein AB6A40_005968 [Gnathostoma spinigerum]|uniref:aconitate hydratase n=1 Tax=Gnathostoma spinigerum TaxID=75299 RepID=A0ABD6EH08_9BILA